MPYTRSVAVMFIITLCANSCCALTRKERNMDTYILTVKTNDRYVLTGTNETVQVKITGDNGNSTDWNTLDYFFENDFEAGATRDYTVNHQTSNTVGPPIVVTFRLVGGSTSKNWMVDHVIAKHNEIMYTFPIYKWVENDEVAVTLGKAELPQNVKSDVVKKLRASEIQYNQSLLQWNVKPTSIAELGWGIARYLHVDATKGLPRLYSNTRGQKSRGNLSGLGVAVNTGVNLFRGPTALNNLDDYRLLYEGTEFKDPIFLGDWKKDVEFGRQVLTGISPTAFERCKVLPAGCNITEQHVGNMLENGKTLASEIAAGKIYIADYRYTSSIERNKILLSSKVFSCADCIGLFYVTTAGDFVPIAIQLVPGDAESVFTPTDNAYDWLLAKIYFRSTQSTVHEWMYHFFLTHGLSETFSVATFRSLPHCHPLYKLLKPHLTSVVSINEQARGVLLPPGSLANQAISLSAIGTVRHFYKNFNLSDVDLEQNIKSRGVDDPKLLPNYHYRDDGLDVWNALKTYVGKVIKFFYSTNQDVKNDFELQGWASDLANEGLGWQDGNTRGMPGKIESIDDLIRICTIIIFQSSAQHAAVNFGQMETYQFVPNAPASMVMPPHKKGEGSAKRIMDSLPGLSISSILVAFAYALSMYAQDEVFLGDFPENLFVEAEVIQIQKDFKADLNKLGLKFNNRNKSLKYPYWYQLPDKIPIDINI